MTQPMEVDRGLFAFKVDEGVDHYVIAHTAQDAKDVVVESMYAGHQEDREWLASWAEVDVYALDEASLRKARFFDDEESTMLDEMMRDPTRRYVACSEY